MNSMLNNWPIDPAVVIIALGVITLLLLIMTVICIMQTSRLYRIRTLSKNVKGSYQKFGMVKYNAFKGMGGNLSFAFAMLDQNNTGFILNSVHSREGCYLYIKDIEKGETETLLGSEEKEALERALGY